MGNFFEDLFFGKSESPEVQRVETLSGQQKGLLQNLAEKMNVLLGQPGRVPGFPIVPPPGALTQQLFGQNPALVGQSMGAVGRGLQPLTAQGLQQGSQPYLDSLMGQFQNQVVPEIAGQFGALDSARSSGMANVLGRAGAQLPGIAQQQFLGQRAAETGAGFQGLGFGAGVAGEQDRLNQLFSQGRLQQWQMGQPGADPRMKFLPLALGMPAFGNIGLPGSQSASPLTGIGQGMMGIGMMGGTLGGVGKGIGSLLGLLSDVRVKENIKPIEHTYNYIGNSPDNRNGGVMAQDVENVLPDAVTEINGVKFVRYDAVVGLLVNAVNELREEIRSN
jgi:hypothetical protein